MARRANRGCRHYLVPLLIVSLLLTACGGLPAQPPPPTATLIPYTPEVTVVTVHITETPTPNPTASPQPAPTPAPPNPVRITDPGCCTDAFWSPDSREVWFLDQPDPGETAGLYGVRLGDSENIRFLVNKQVGLPSPDGRYLAYLGEFAETTIIDTLFQREWTIDNEGARVYFSPNSERVIWVDTMRITSSQIRSSTVYVADVSGENPRELTTVYGGGFAGWLDDETILLAGRSAPEAIDLALYSFDISSGARVNLAVNQRIWSVNPAPGGEWVFYSVTLGTVTDQYDGLWIVSRDGETLYQLDVTAGTHWRDGTRLIFIPQVLDAASHEIWQFDTATGQAERLFDPADLPVRVSAANWAISPDGEKLVYLSARDDALYVISLSTDD